MQNRADYTSISTVLYSLNQGDVIADLNIASSIPAVYERDKGYIGPILQEWKLDKRKKKDGNFVSKLPSIGGAGNMT